MNICMVLKKCFTLLQHWKRLEGKSYIILQFNALKSLPDNYSLTSSGKSDVYLNSIEFKILWLQDSSNLNSSKRYVLHKIFRIVSRIAFFQAQLVIAAF